MHQNQRSAENEIKREERTLTPEHLQKGLPSVAQHTFNPFTQTDEK